MDTLAKKSLIFVFVLFPLLSNGEISGYDNPIIENTLSYQINTNALKKGSFQYFFSILKQDHKDGDIKVNYFKNLTAENCKTKVKDIVDTFMPLDTKNLWDDKDKNYLAVAKMSFILPIDIAQVNEARFNSVQYLQKTMPNYEVTKNKDYYFVDGSMLTPAFDLYVKFLTNNHPYLKLNKDINLDKIKTGKMKVSFQHQDKFGKVMMVETAKMASAMTIYQEFGKDETLVTQYILSNVINVPTKSMLRNGMIENMQNVVKGSRLAVKEMENLTVSN